MITDKELDLIVTNACQTKEVTEENEAEFMLLVLSYFDPETCMWFSSIPLTDDNQEQATSLLARTCWAARDSVVVVSDTYYITSDDVPGTVLETLTDPEEFIGHLEEIFTDEAHPLHDYVFEALVVTVVDHDNATRAITIPYVVQQDHTITWMDRRDHADAPRGFLMDVLTGYMTMPAGVEAMKNGGRDPQDFDLTEDEAWVHISCAVMKDYLKAGLPMATNPALPKDILDRISRSLEGLAVEGTPKMFIDALNKFASRSKPHKETVDRIQEVLEQTLANKDVEDMAPDEIFEILKKVIQDEVGVNIAGGGIFNLNNKTSKMFGELSDQPDDPYKDTETTEELLAELTAKMDEMNGEHDG